MQGIDISNWQRGIDLSRVPCDFVIVKSTEGTNYVDPCCDGFVQQCKRLGKLWGFYHYVTGGYPENEADFWIANTENYFRDGLPCVDWESGGNYVWGDTDYLRRFVQRVIDKTGVKPLIYASAAAFPWSVCSELDCGAWVAQYASNNATKYQERPWNEGAYDCTIRQYTSMGRLDGWSGDLDLDKAYMSREEWDAWADGAQQEGWIQQDGRWWYRHADGSYTMSGWEQIDGKWYLFDADGWMLTGWQQVGGKWYYLTDSGAMATGWVNDGGKWYYMDPDTGAMHAADVDSIGGKWYAFGSDGEMQYGVGSDASGALKV